MELYIDNRRVDTDSNTGVAISLSVSVITDPGRGRAGYTRSVRLPMTAMNDEIFLYAGEIQSRDRFNATPHTGRIEYEGAVLFEGQLYLDRVERSTEGGFYEVYIIGAAKEWAGRAAARSLRHTPVEYSETLTGRLISASWTDSSPVKFLPVARGRTERDYSSGGVVPAMRVASSDDYHPFIHAETLLRAIFAESGYRVESDFIAGEMFSSLYISGNYPTRDAGIVKANMDFFARCLTSRSATADSLGRVYANPYRAGFSIGNIVDAPDAGAGGNVPEDIFSRNGCFGRAGDRIAFVPLSEVSVGFRYHLSYTTDYRIKTRGILAGFDTVYLGGESEHGFTLANPYPDRRSSFRNPQTFKLAVFDHITGRQYQLRYSRQMASGGTVTENSAVLTARFSAVTVAAGNPVTNPVLWYRASSTGNWAVYSGDWALYDGFVNETGTMDVELTVRTPSEIVTPGLPKFFDTIFFGGADPGMRFTVRDKTWMQPVFYAQPTEGSCLTFADVCAHDASQMDFINALRQMFNLTFQTDNRARVVRIEPRDGFWSGGRITDWTERQEIEKGVVVEELGSDLVREMVWCYRSGDAAVGSFNRSDGEQLGRWSVAVENTAAADGTSVWENAMFTPSLNASDIYATAPSALLVQAGDISSELLDRTEDLNFTPKIVRYEGMVALPAGESWGWPLSGGSYPKIAFHAPESRYTLCFENRDCCAGLRSHYDGDVRIWNEGRRVTLWLDLDPCDIESLAFPAGRDGGFNSLYRLAPGGESALYRLEEVCEYNPGGPSAKCSFIKHIP